jgi:hypothetical protein
MQKLKPLQVEHANLKDSLHKWIQAKEGFEDKDSWPRGQLSPYEIHRRIDQSADHIQAYVNYVKGMAGKKYDWVPFHIDNNYQHIRDCPVEMAKAVRDGTDVLLDHCEHREVFLSWQAVCASVDLFARSAAEELKDLRSNYPDLSEEALLGAVCLLDSLGNEAIECRDKGIKGYLESPLRDYAL